MPTLKNFAVPIGFPLNWVNMSASGASLTCIGRWHKNNWDTSNTGFISNKQAQLIKRPIIGSASFSLTSWLLIQRLSDISQVFKSQGCIQLLCLLNKLLGNVVIQPLLELLLSPRKPSQKSTTRPSAFGLNISPDRRVSVTNSLNLLSTPRLACGSGSNISSAQINPNYFWGLPSWLGGQVNTNIDVVVTLFSLVERSSSWRLPLEQSQLVVTDAQLQLNPTTHQSNANSLQLLNVLKSPHVQINRCRSKLVDLLNCLGVANYAPDCLANMVGFQSRSFSHYFIGLVVKLGCIPAVLAFGNIQYLVTSISKREQSAVYLRGQLYRDLKLAFNRYCLHLDGSLSHRILACKAVLEGRGFKPIFSMTSQDSLFRQIRYIFLHKTAVN